MLRARSSRLRLSTRAAVRAMTVSPSTYYAEIRGRALALCPAGEKQSKREFLMRRCEHRRHNPRREAETIDLRHALAWLLLLAAAVFASSPGNRHADVRQVDVPEARALIDAGALVIDVRDRAASGP